MSLKISKRIASISSFTSLNVKFGIEFDLSFLLDGKGWIEIIYDQPLVYDFDGEISGFSYCQKSSDECDRIKEGREWISLDFENIKIINKTALRIISLDFQDFEVKYF